MNKFLIEALKVEKFLEVGKNHPDRSFSAKKRKVTNQTLAK